MSYKMAFKNYKWNNKTAAGHFQTISTKFTLCQNVENDVDINR